MPEKELPNNYDVKYILDVLLYQPESGQQNFIYNPKILSQLSMLVKNCT